MPRNTNLDPVGQHPAHSPRDHPTTTGAPIDPRHLRHVVDSIHKEDALRRGCEATAPRIAAVHQWVELLRRIVFVGYFEPRDPAPGELDAHIADLLSHVRAVAADQLARAIRFAAQTATPPRAPDPDLHHRAERMADDFIAAIPALRAAVALDVLAAYEGDPAASSIDETILCYPGVDAVFVHRAAHILHRMGAPLIPRIMSELAHARSGIDIHPGAAIGESFFIDHGTGVVIGETAVIGKHVRIYQGVTIGAKTIERDTDGRVVRGRKRHPTIGDRVTIYADAVILGADTTVGDDCIVSGAVFLTQSVPPGHIVRAKQPELKLRSNRHAPRD